MNEAQIIRDALAGVRPFPTLITADNALNALVDRLQQAEHALAEIHAKPYRAEEVTARYRRETL